MPKHFNSTPAIILLIEDNEGDAVLTEEALLESKVSVRMYRVSNGMEALAYLRREGGHAEAERPDLIMLDLNMPRMNGREFLEIVKADPALAGIPVVILTTSAVEEDIIKSYELQASCYITKPVDFDQFQNIVREISEFWFTLVKLPATAGSSRRTA